MFIGNCLQTIPMNYGLTISLFLGGMVGSVAHCTTMCSPYVLAQSTDGFELRRPSGTLLLPYHLGRMTTYVFLGMIFYSLVNLAYLFSGIKNLIAAPLLVMAGILFLVNAFPKSASFFPWASKISYGFAPIRFLQNMIAILCNGKRFYQRYMLGVLLGFMPCGLVIAAIMAAATAKNVGVAAAGMAAFAAGTMPILMMIGIGGTSIKVKYPNFAQKFSKAALLGSSLWLFMLAGTMILQKGQ